MKTGPDPTTIAVGSIGSHLEIIGDYVLVKRIASGGMCDTWLGLQLFLSELVRPVVVKRVDPKLMGEEGFRRRFFHEVAIMDRVRSPFIVPVYEVGNDAQAPFIVAAYVQGLSVAELIGHSRALREPIPQPIAARIAADALNGLHAIHTLLDQQGTLLRAVHHELTAKSVMVSFDGSVQLTDSGIGKAADGFSRELRWFNPFKARYKSPEQAKGLRGNARADQYAIALMLFELLTASVAPAFASTDNHRELLDAVNPTVEERLIKIVLRGLSRDPKARFRSSAEMAAELEELGARRLDQFMKDRFMKELTETRMMLEHAEVAAGSGTRRSPRRRGTA